MRFAPQKIKDNGLGLNNKAFVFYLLLSPSIFFIYFSFSTL